MMRLLPRIQSHILTQPVLEINLRALVDNFKLLEKMAGGAVAGAVVKDDAYGAGAQVVSKTLYEQADCRHFWVAHAIEGAKIVEYVKDAKIYVLQGIGEDSVAIFEKYPFIPVITSLDMWRYFKKHGRSDIKPVIYIETGLNRLGFRAEDLKKLSKSDLNRFSMVMSHLACADERAHFMNEIQLSRFMSLKEKYFKDLPASISASDGVFLGKDFCFDMVRLGAAMYGINTAPYRPNSMKNMITLKAPVLQISDLKKGDFVGYGATYRASDDKKIAIISIGYGDGVPRSLSNIGKVFFKHKGQWCESRILGRVSMDNVICDVSLCDDLCVGDFGYLIFDNYTLDDIARDAGTIGYEIISNIGKNERVCKKYIGVR